jgi:hypothetical protein
MATAHDNVGDDFFRTKGSELAEAGLHIRLESALTSELIMYRLICHE